MFSRQGKKGSGSTKVVKVATVRHFYKFLDPYRPKDPGVNVSIDMLIFSCLEGSAAEAVACKFRKGGRRGAG